MRSPLRLETPSAFPRLSFADCNPTGRQAFFLNLFQSSFRSFPAQTVYLLKRHWMAIKSGKILNFIMNHHTVAVLSIFSFLPFPFSHFPLHSSKRAQRMRCLYKTGLPECDEPLRPAIPALLPGRLWGKRLSRWSAYREVPLAAERNGAGGLSGHRVQQRRVSGLRGPGRTVRPRQKRNTLHDGYRRNAFFHGKQPLSFRRRTKRPFRWNGPLVFRGQPKTGALPLWAQALAQSFFLPDQQAFSRHLGRLF